jgi:hypothetical protein
MKNKPITTLLSMFVAICTTVLAVTTIPFDSSRGLVEVNVLLDGRVKGKFGIDTGADKLYVDRKFAERNGFRFAENTRRRQSVGIDGTSSIAFVDFKSLKVGEERLSNLRATVIDIVGLAQNPAAHPPDGLIGYDILSRYYLTVDYPSRQMSLQTEKPHFLSGRSYSEFAFWQRKHLILVDVVINDRVTCSMILDYCASHTSIAPSLAVELGLNATIGKRHIVEQISMTDAITGNDIDVNEVPVVVTDLAHYRRSVPQSGFVGILGGTFLSRLNLTVDYSKKRIYIRN